MALDLLYENEMSGIAVEEIIARHASNPVIEFAGLLAKGALERQGQIDELITRHSAHWSLERMPVIDRLLIRLGVFEILYLGDVPAPVSINEAVELAKTYSGEDSGRFVNGVLGKIAEEAQVPSPYPATSAQGLERPADS